MAQEPKIQDCWDGNKCRIDEHCGETGGICSSSLLWSKENKFNLTSELNGQVQVIDNNNGSICIILKSMNQIFNAVRSQNQIWKILQKKLWDHFPYFYLKTDSRPFTVRAPL